MPRRAINHYIYWSDRLTGELADELRVNREPRWLLNLSGRTPIIGIEAQRRGNALRLDEIAKKIESRGILHDFSVNGAPQATPYFIRGNSKFMAFIRSVRSSKPQGAAVSLGLISDNVTTLTEVPGSADGRFVYVNRVHLCLFGSADNFIGYRGAAKQYKKDLEEEAAAAPEGWQPSSYVGIQSFLDRQGIDDELESPSQIMPKPLLDDISAMEEMGNRAQEVALRAVRWARSAANNDSTELVINQNVDWCAQIFVDISPNLRDSTENWLHETRRILVGAPLWIRTRVSGPL